MPEEESVSSDTTIALRESTRDKLFNLKRKPSDTYDDVIRELMDDYE